MVGTKSICDTGYGYRCPVNPSGYFTIKGIFVISSYGAGPFAYKQWDALISPWSEV